jgi:SPX domain protein involved in polyphosphate accumulation
MAIEVFNRYENKYLIDSDTMRYIQEELCEYTAPDEYNRLGATYPIYNIYYDTPDNEMIRTSLSKPLYKEKLRLRAYSNFFDDEIVYLEIKKKCNGLVNKRRSAMSFAEASRFLSSGEAPRPRDCMNMQVINEVAYCLERMSLEAAAYIAYDRRAYFGTGKHDLRVSFDTNIRTRRTSLSFEAGDYGEPLLAEGMALMEIKVRSSIPLWLSRLLSSADVFPVSFSKYGKEYASHVERKRDTINKTFTGETQEIARVRALSGTVNVRPLETRADSRPV